jgi:Immunity protein 26
MEKKKRQKIKDGAVVKINLLENRLIFGRLMKSRIAIYDFLILESAIVPDLETIIGNPIFLYCSVYNDVITKGIFEIIGFKELTENEIENIPPKFTQDMVDINKCVIYYHDGREFKAKPGDCIGLERSSVWEAQGLVERIQDHYAGKRNFHVELMKPILSTKDPRYLPKPNELRWNFEKQEFYKIE